jgi:hypothetical protein
VCDANWFNFIKCYTPTKFVLFLGVTLPQNLLCLGWEPVSGFVMLISFNFLRCYTPTEFALFGAGAIVLGVMLISLNFLRCYTPTEFALFGVGAIVLGVMLISL